MGILGAILGESHPLNQPNGLFGVFNYSLMFLLSKKLKFYPPENPTTKYIRFRFHRHLIDCTTPVGPEWNLRPTLLLPGLRAILYSGRLLRRLRISLRGQLCFILLGLRTSEATGRLRTFSLREATPETEKGSINPHQDNNSPTHVLLRVILFAHYCAVCSLAEKLSQEESESMNS